MVIHWSKNSTDNCYTAYDIGRLYCRYFFKDKSQVTVFDAISYIAGIFFLKTKVQVTAFDVISQFPLKTVFKKTDNEVDMTIFKFCSFGLSRFFNYIAHIDHLRFLTSPQGHFLSHKVINDGKKTHKSFAVITALYISQRKCLLHLCSVAEAAIFEFACSSN